MEKMYGILMAKKYIDAGIYLFSPVYPISGEYDEEMDVFSSDQGDAYLSFTNVINIDEDNEFSVGFIISDDKLHEMYPDYEIEDAMGAYFDKVRECAHIGFLMDDDDDEDKIVIVDVNLNKVDSLIHSAKNGEDISNVNAPINNAPINVNSDGTIKNVVAIPFEEYEKLIMNIDDTDYVKKSLLNIYEAIKMVKNGEINEEEQVDDKTTFKGNYIEKLFEVSYKEVMKSNEKDMIHVTLDELADNFVSLSLLFDERGKDIYEAEIAKDYIYDLVDRITEINKLNSIVEIKTRITDIYNNELRDIRQLGVVFDRCTEHYNKGKRALSYQTKVEFKKAAEKESVTIKPLFDVKDAKKFFDAKIMRQDQAKKDVLSAIIMNSLSENPNDKNNILLVGPTGSGKTLIAETVSDYFKMPMEIIDTTQLTVPGYVGANIEDFLRRLVDKAGGDVKKAERGIVVFDELDKKGSAKNDDVSGKGVLNVLLPFIQGTTYDFKYNGRNVQFNTSKLTIFATGAFTDVALHKAENSAAISSDYNSCKIGFNSKVETKSDKDEDIKYPTFVIDDFVKYGNMPVEIMGRFPVIAQLEGHNIESLKEILTGSNVSALLAEKKKLEKLGLRLEWTSGYLDAAARKAIELKTGARSLKSTVEKSIKEARWELLENLDMYSGVILTEKTVEDNTDCLLIDKQGNTHSLKEILNAKNITSLVPSDVYNTPKKYIKK